MARTGALGQQILDRTIKSEDLTSDLHLSGSTTIQGTLNISSSDARITSNKLKVDSIELDGDILTNWNQIEEDAAEISSLKQKLFFGNAGSFGDGDTDNDIVRTDNNPFALSTSSSNFTPDHYRILLDQSGTWVTLQIGTTPGYVVSGHLTNNGVYRYLAIASSTSSLETNIDFCTVTIEG